MSTRFECAVCSNPVSIRFDLCSRCIRQFRELYGDNYMQIEWIKYLTQNKHYIDKLEKEETKGWAIGTSYEMNHHYIQETDALTNIDGKRIIDTGSGNHYTLPNKHKRSDYDADISHYVREGLGYKRIHKLLAAKYGIENIPSTDTIFHRTKEFRGLEVKR